MTLPTRRERVVETLQAGQARLIAAFGALDDTARFSLHTWERPGGGGGMARVLEGGRVLERAGINFSAVHGDAVPPSLAAAHPGSEGKPYFATGLSMVFHPCNPHAPAFHANYRYFEVGGELPPGELERLREAGLLYDRDAAGEYLHCYTETIGTVFFELVERRDRYDGFGAANTPVRLTAQHLSH